jgi:predicted nucleic acid-binding protein
LKGPCVADNSLLVNFVHAGAADLLHDLLGGPLYLTPTVLDDREALEAAGIWTNRRPTSEFLRPLQRALVAEQGDWRGEQAADVDYSRRIAPHLTAFARQRGVLWEPAQPTIKELTHATYLADRAVRTLVREQCEGLKGRVELDAGEAEVVAVSTAREWTVLVDDQAAVNLLACLFPTVRIIRTCELLVYATCIGRIDCGEAARLFNHVIVEQLGFHAFRSGERLYLRCDPVGCRWEAR